MGTAVGDQPDLLVVTPQHDDRLEADAPGTVVARIRHLALVADVDPFAVPDLLQLFLKDPRIVVEPPVDAVSLDQAVIVDCRQLGDSHRLGSLSWAPGQVSAESTATERSRGAASDRRRSLQRSVARGYTLPPPDRACQSPCCVVPRAPASCGCRWIVCASRRARPCQLPTP